MLQLRKKLRHANILLVLDNSKPISLEFWSDYYIDTYLSNENVIVLGDLNDELTDLQTNNVFWNFISDPNNYLFLDMEIAQDSPEYW